MMKTKQIVVKVYLRHHLSASYIIVFESETTCDAFVNALNADTDFIRIVDDVIERKSIRKVTIR